MTEKLDIIVAISMILSGLFMMLVGFDIIKLSSKKPEDVERMIVWRRKWGMFFKIGGIVMVILAIYLLIALYLNRKPDDWTQSQKEEMKIEMINSSSFLQSLNSDTANLIVSCYVDKYTEKYTLQDAWEQDKMTQDQIVKLTIPIINECIELYGIRNNNIEREEIVFDIIKFKLECDSLLKTLKNIKYSFEIKSDTFNFGIDNEDNFTKGHGIFYLLLRDSSERIVRHHLFEPKTKKQLRVYLVEAEYNKSDQLDKVLSNLEISMNTLMFDNKWRLSPVNDYIIASDKKLFWLNVSYPYSNSEFLKFVDCLKNNVDTTKYKGRIICLFGSDCRIENVP